MQLYFVAIHIPSPIDSEIREYQKEMDTKFGSSRQLRIPVHITLVPPFRFNAEESVIDAFVKATSDLNCPSEIKLDGFNQFREKVLFVAVKENSELSLLRSQVFKRISDELSIEWPEYTSNFHPHITIANRDLTRDAFKKAWPIFKDRPYKRTFDKIELVLYKHIDGLWQVRSSRVISE